MTEKILVPNIGDFKNVEIIEVLVKEGDKINKGDPIITLESDKSSVEVPSTINGSIEKVKIKIGDKVSEGDLILTINPENKQVEKKKEKTIKEVKTSKSVKKTTATPIITQVASSGIVGASPNVMRFARELGVDLSQVHGTGRDGRVLEVDIKEHVKNIGSASSSKKNIVEDMPYAHSEFGAIKVEKIPRIKRLSGPHLVNAWSTIPHVTQHDEIDVTEMETFRKNLTDLNTKEKIPITPIAFIIRALVNAMKRYPNFNSSIDPIKEVSEMTELKPYVLRYWESEFPSLKPSKNRAGNRTYKKQDIQVILDIKKLLYQKKFTIKGAVEELKNRTNNPVEEKILSSTQISALSEIKNELKNILNILNRH